MFKNLNQLNGIKIVDFGLAQSMNDDVYQYPRCGTPGYVAPEIVGLKDQSLKYDAVSYMFSVGCIFYKL